MNEDEKTTWRWSVAYSLITQLIPIVVQHVLDVRKEAIKPPEKEQAKAESFAAYVKGRKA